MQKQKQQHHLKMMASTWKNLLKNLVISKYRLPEISMEKFVI